MGGPWCSRRGIWPTAPVNSPPAPAWMWPSPWRRTRTRPPEDIRPGPPFCAIPGRREAAAPVSQCAGVGIPHNNLIYFRPEGTQMTGMRSQMSLCLTLWLGLSLIPGPASAQLAPTGGHYAGRASDTGHEPGMVNASGGYVVSVPLDLPAERGGPGLGGPPLLWAAQHVRGRPPAVERGKHCAAGPPANSTVVSRSRAGHGPQGADMGSPEQRTRTLLARAGRHLDAEI